jgi:Uma2 family endonuclease
VLADRMAGGTARHNEVASNLHLALASALAGQGCHPLGADQRIRVSPDEYTYADVSVYCGRIEIAPGNPPDTATNPVVLVEVLSDKTRTYDTTDKLERYQHLATVREILLVEPEDTRIVHFTRTPTGWSQATTTDLPGTIEVLGQRVALADIYARRVT